jgi:hypothetical protein
MSIYVYHSDKAEEEGSVFWCKVMTSWGSEMIVKVTHTFNQEMIPDSYSSLRLIYKGEFVRFSTPREYDDFVNEGVLPQEELFGGAEFPPEASVETSSSCTCPAHCSLHCPNCGTQKNIDDDKPKPQKQGSGIFLYDQISSAIGNFFSKFSLGKKPPKAPSVSQLPKKEPEVDKSPIEVDKSPIEVDKSPIEEPEANKPPVEEVLPLEIVDATDFFTYNKLGHKWGKPSYLNSPFF